MANAIIERMTSFKLLVVTISADLSLDEHVSTMCKKASKRLHFMQLLKLKAGINVQHRDYRVLQFW